MARYKLLTQYGYPQLEIGEVYEENKILEAPDITVLYMADRYPKDWQLVGDRKIVGYKAPKDLFDGEVRCGIIYKPLASVMNKSYAATNILGQPYLSKYNLPKEIVESWEPVYEESFPDITINGYKGKFFDDFVKFGCAKINKGLILKIWDLIINPNWSKIDSKEIESVTIGKGTFTKDQIKEIAEYYLNKK